MLLKNYELVTDPTKVYQVAQALDRVPTFALDLETTGLEHMRDTVHGIALATDDREWYLCHDAVQPGYDYLRDVVTNKTVVLHNAKFDMHFLQRQNVVIPNPVDTMLAQGLVNENLDLGLKSLAHTRLGIRQPLPDFRELQHLAKRMLRAKRLGDISIYDIPLHTLAEYAARDARLTLDLWGKLQYDLAQENMETLFYEMEMPFMRVLLDMEETGFYIDQEKLALLDTEFAQKRDEAYIRVMDIIGAYVENPGSDQQLRHYFYEVKGYQPTIFTDTGQPSVDVQSLNRLRDQDDTGAVDAILELRKYEKLITTYITNFYAGLIDGRLYGDFNQNGAVTGRLSSSNPNLQNIPARYDEAKLVRALFAAPEGYGFLDIDYSQLELRLGAHYTKDQHLMNVFITGGDPHQMTADMCKVARYIGKTLNFLVFYGGGPNKLRDTVEKNGYERPSLKEAREYLNAFGGAYPTINIWKERVWKVARQLGYVWTISGRRRRLPDINSRDNSLRSQAERQAVNAIIQGSASDITKWAQIQIHKFQHEYGARMLAQVHDEIAWEVPLEAIEEFGQKASEIMVAAGEHFGIRVPMEAVPQWGANWAEAK